MSQRVVIVGASVSAADIATDIAGIAETPITCIVRGKYNGYFGDTAFKNPHLKLRSEISWIDAKTRTVHLSDGSSVENIDNIIFGTGYSWSLPFLPQIEIRNNRIPGLYHHIFHRSDPTLTFVGAVSLTFHSILQILNFAGRSRPYIPCIRVASSVYCSISSWARLPSTSQ